MHKIVTLGGKPFQVAEPFMSDLAAVLEALTPADYRLLWRALDAVKDKTGDSVLSNADAKALLKVASNAAPVAAERFALACLRGDDRPARLTVSEFLRVASAAVEGGIFSDLVGLLKNLSAQAAAKAQAQAGPQAPTASAASPKS